MNPIEEMEKRLIKANNVSWDSQLGEGKAMAYKDLCQDLIRLAKAYREVLESYLPEEVLLCNPHPIDREVKKLLDRG